MQIKKNVMVKHIDGNPLQKQDGAGDLLLKDVMIAALLSVLPADRDMSGIKKFELGDLAARIYADGDEVEMSVEEVALVKARIGDLYVPAVVRPAWKILEGK